MNPKKLPLLFVPFFLGAVGTVIPLAATGCSRHPTVKQTAEKTIWTCSMHPQIRQDHPGDCPICGMKLVPLHTHGGEASQPVVPLVAATNDASSSAASPAASVSEASPDAMAAPEAPGLIRLDAAQSSVASIRTVPVGEHAVLRKIELFGEIAYVADRHVDFTWYYGGRIQQVLIDYNTTEVAAGTPILEVYSDEAIADQRAYLEALRQRWLSTFYERRNYDAQIAAIRERLSRIGITEGNLKALEKQGAVMSTFLIRAPKSGSILGALPHAGERFTPDRVLFHLAPLEEVWFVADVYEHDIGLLKPGQEITLRCQAHPEQIFTGKLVFIDREVDPQKRTVKVRFLVPNPRRELLPQLSATGLLEVASPGPMLTIPASAVIETGKRQLVYLEKAPHTYALRSVTIGPEGTVAGEGDARWVPVMSGLQAGERVVVSGAFLIDAEAQLQGKDSSSTEMPSSSSSPDPLP